MIIYMKKSYKKRSKKIKGGNQTKELENLNNLFLNRKYKLAITKDGKEEMYDVKYTGPQLNSQGALSHKFSHIFKMQHSKFNTDSDLNLYSWKLLVPSRSATGTSTRTNDGEQADRSPERGGNKKRNRKRSTKKKARRRTRKAGTKKGRETRHSKLAMAVMRRRFQQNKHNITNTPGAIRNLQKLPLDNPDADQADAIVMEHMRNQPQNIGMNRARREAMRKKKKERKERQKSRAERERDFNPKPISLISRKRKLGGKRKRKTRRRRRR